MKKIVSLLLVTTLMFSGCGKIPEAAEKHQYSVTYMTVFDTVTTIVGMAESEKAFGEKAEKVYEELEEYHKLFDIYNEYEGIANLKTINDRAGTEPVKVDERIIRLLQDCKDIYQIMDGKVNVAMGSVLSLWHEARDYGRNNPKDAVLPEMEALQLAAEHMDFDDVVIDTEASTVYIEDPMVRLDVGAIAKGWSVQEVARSAPEGLLISVGGNVCVTGAKDSQGNPWVVGIENPDGSPAFLHTIYLTGGSVVTSGDYQRTYQVDGKSYHHIIDPDTLYPAAYWRIVTVICEDSGIGDALSTALFVLPEEEGLKLLEQYKAEAMWVDLKGKKHYSHGFEKYIRR